jgi:hypothetical protein
LRLRELRKQMGDATRRGHPVGRPGGRRRPLGVYFSTVHECVTAVRAL